ncbi:MAG: ABC transporter permease [Defluviitaleaceae bacterium]|nr:ABC transporter permease [Defluviitaleaceae bacterium]
MGPIKEEAAFSAEAPSLARIIWKEIYTDKVALIALIVFSTIMVSTMVLGFTIDEDFARRSYLVFRDQGPSEQFFLGTDDGGRDMVAMIILGARNSILIGFAVTILGSILGIAIGLVSGFYGGQVDNIIMRITDTWLMLPTLMIIILFVSLIPNYQVWQFVGILVIFAWMGTTRIIRAMALQQRNLDYVSASKTLGTRNIVIMVREVLPNLIPVITVNLTLGLAGNMGVETGLTFLGFGLPFGTPSLGRLIAMAARPAALQFRMWQWLPAALLIFTLMLSVYCVGQAVQRAADVRQRRAQ